MVKRYSLRAFLIALFLPCFTAFQAPQPLAGCQAKGSNACPASMRLLAGPRAVGLRALNRGLELRMQEGTPIHNAIDKVVKDNKVVVFMKGTKDMPQCGFSNTVVQILNSCNADFEAVNVLESDVLRQGIKTYSSWPTIPQLYVDGEFLGGCDITIDMFQSGELVEILERVQNE
mmetsp:Transcript_37348/g.58345  ORF Transcript_37348/g.58345 Transcript_37348/m.58345 type:complete len:174 (-) Transcript_37348:73-594(-)|eukprot:CAMPEP_0184296840 /NCGR_PEP_ID=MMETSP1049-20130417/7798_1 /TAXON_ID=77928 /ORGANISM="Proteomonas sulcata, Strain CCMP704" /LENGTH=173 /DNA_ID=CAMNT_0026606279 /DNA_START=12 /DNA_END=533 /DNA_ORIENTATION=-